VNSPMSSSSYGIKEKRVDKDALDVHVQEVQMLGYTVLEPAVPAERLAAWRSSIDRILGELAAESGGVDALQRIGEADTVRALLAYDGSFLDIATDPQLIEICKRLLGDYFILMLQNGVVNQPAQQPHHQAAYHRDLPYQHFVSSRPLAVSALFCLDPFESENGSTMFIPGSHKVEEFPSDDYVQKMQSSISAPAGAVIVFDSMLFHRAGINRSKSVRRAVNNVFALPFLKQQIVLPALLNGKWSEDPWLKRLLGYESDPPRSPAEFRALRAQRT
jgi:ectoine hydroxylase-related dioxygenase (phytanoyl-CoA dioxygenase family)